MALLAWFHEHGSCFTDWGEVKLFNMNGKKKKMALAEIYEVSLLTF